MADQIVGGPSTTRSRPGSRPPSRSVTPTLNSAPPSPNPSRAASSSTAASSDDAARAKIVLGVCAMDRKSRSKPMRNILNRLVSTDKFEVVLFGDKVILDEDISQWPCVDVLITFFSTGFPIDKAISYINLRKPICVNDLPLQKIFFDRRVVQMVLDKIGVRTPRRISADRDGGPQLDPAVIAQIQRDIGVKVETNKPPCDFQLKDDDTILINGKAISKPFVEKPVSGEDHNVHIYFRSKGSKGVGGGRRLFRKVGNKASEYDASMVQPRTDASYIYEEFINGDNAEDIKVYTLGPNFVHAESRKSPVVDGVVRRNNEGKEIRFITQLTEEERTMARNIATAFKQNICGFDLLRAGGKSYVIDVNGWSFVKGNDHYYDKCAEILERFCTSRLSTALPIPSGMPSPKEAKSWRLKASSSVFRHADRTPKMKLKFNLKSLPWSQPFVKLLQGRKDEIILRQTEQLNLIAAAAQEAKGIPDCDAEKLEQLIKILDKKVGLSGTKAQIKPTFVDDTDECEKVQIIIKWGGEFTHAARYQSRDLGDNMRKDFALMNKSLLDNTTIFTSSERRVVATAEVFSGAILADVQAAQEHELIVRKDLLDDSNAAKAPMELVKKRLKTILRPGEYTKPDFCWPVPEVEPVQVVKQTMELMRWHRDALNANWASMDVENIQARWCCSEYPYLFRERWEKLFDDFCDVTPEKFDPARVSELYDSLKYDSLHNRTFLETIFSPSRTGSTPHSTPHASSTRLSAKQQQSTLAAASESAVQAQSTDKDDAPSSGGGPPKKLKELYSCAKTLFDLIGPQEYGIERSEKREIGLLTSWPLLHRIEQDLRAAASDEPGRACFYFTKESHIQTLVNLILFSDLHVVMGRVPELDYMAFITFEVYSREASDEGGVGDSTTEYSVRISLSEGAHAMPLDTSLDAKHALQVQPRRVLTNHVPLDDVLASIAKYHRHSSILQKSTTPFEGMVEGDVVFPKAGKANGEVPTVVSDVHTLTFIPRSRPDSVASGDMADHRSDHSD